MNKQEFLAKYIFFGLTDLNNGFDVEAIKYFSQKDFEIVLSRIEKHGLGIYGIETWEDEAYNGTMIFEDSAKESIDPKWYKDAFQQFIKDGPDLHYTASYFVPENLLK